MRGTNYSKGGFRRITRLDPPVRVRLLGFGVVVVCGSLLLFWVTRTTWDQLDQLQKEHSAVKSESFYLGVSLRSSIRSLNGKLLQFGLSREPSVREAFLKESAELNGWMETNRLHLVEIADLRLLQRMGLSTDLELLEKATNAFREYLDHTSAILASGPPPPELDTFEEVYARVQEASVSLLGICDELVKVQGRGFSEFLSETQDTLMDHQRLLEISSALILVLAGTLAILVYRGMIAPLRKGLTRSHTIIQRQEKLASLGILASGVAHEIRNPLTAIKFRLFSLKNSLPELSGNEDATLIANEINRLERIVKDFLQFARPSEPEMGRVALPRVVKEVQDLLKMQLERMGIQLKVDAGEPVWVHADAQQIKQVLINLIQNAAEAIGRNGRVTVGIRQATAELEGRTGPAAVLQVADTGKGIAPEVEARLFDPFFTTKERGTGLGLAIAARIVEKHGGVLRYETELNRGTTFEVVLPRVTNDATTNPVDRR
ncbi:MAG TPA: ATP-binding protein [Verrucomicrobiae bacterium]|nr:ATP-binding protein [Verrucomicrobiae bacterium]